MNTLATLFNLGGPDLLIILVIVLVLFGAKKLPELAKGLGQALKEFSKAKNEFENELHKPVTELTVQRPADQQPHYASQTQPAQPHTEPAHEHVAPAREHATADHQPEPATKTQG